jgi:hypothetical protein
MNGRVLGWAVVVYLACCPAVRAGVVADWANSVMQSCWSCDMLNQVTSIGLTLAEQAFSALAGQAANLLGLLMAIWILFFAARMFLPFGPQEEGGASWNRGAKKLFQFAVVLAFLQSSQLFWSYLFIPIMSSGMSFSRTIVTLSDPFEAANGTPETGPTAADSGAGYCSEGSAADGVNGAIAVMNQMNCPMQKVQSQFAKGMFIGIAQIWGAIKQALIGRAVCSIVGGIVLIGVYFIGMILYPVFMIDVLMRVTIVTVLAPVALVASMFGPTKQIAEKAAWQIAQAALTLVFVSIVCGIGKATLAYIFNHLTVDGGVADWNSLIGMLENQKTSTGADFCIDLTTMAFYQLLGVGVILLFMLRQAGRMAAEFTGTHRGDFSGATAGAAELAGRAVSLGGWTAQAVTGSGSGWGGGRSSLARKVSGVSGDVHRSGEDPEEDD